MCVPYDCAHEVYQRLVNMGNRQRSAPDITSHITKNHVRHEKAVGCLPAAKPFVPLGAVSSNKQDFGPEKVTGPA